MPITTTLNKIHSHSPGKDSWEKLLKHLDKTKADDDTLFISTILASNGLADAIWCLRAIDNKQAIAAFARRCADSVKHLRVDATDAAALADCAATDADTDAAAAYAADRAIDAAVYADWAAADAAGCAAYAVAADAAAYAALTVYAAADAAAYTASCDAERKKQEQFLIETFG